MLPNILPEPYTAAPNPNPLAVAISFSSSDVRNCAAPNTPPTALALIAVLIAISVPFSIAGLIADVISAAIALYFTGSCKSLISFFNSLSKSSTLL